MVSKYLSELPAELNTIGKKIGFTAELIEQHRLHHNNNMFVMDNGKLRPKTWQEAEMFFQNKFVLKSKVLHGALNYLLSLKPNGGYVLDTSQGFGGWKKDRPALKNDYLLKESDLSRVDYVGEQIKTIKDPKEDYTTYTKVDNAPPNDRIKNLLANSFDVDGIPRNESIYMYFDKGANFFNDFTQYVDVRLDSSTDSQGFFEFWALTNLIGDLKAIVDASGDANSAQIILSGAVNVLISLLETDAGTIYFDTSVNLSKDTWYYCKPVRGAGILLLCIYSDLARSILLDTLSITLQNVVPFRYVYGIQSWNDGTALSANGAVANLDLQPIAVTAAIPPHIFQRVR